MNINYYLSPTNDGNLFCQISDQDTKIYFSMMYEIDPKLWNQEKEKLADNDPNISVLLDFKEYLTVRYSELIKYREKENVLSI